jgi:hypothetical protein
MVVPGQGQLSEARGSSAPYTKETNTSSLMCCSTWDYLKAVREQLSNSSDIKGGLRPTEVRLPSGCIEEIDANYKGELLSDVLPNTTSGDACCQSCRYQASSSTCRISERDGEGLMIEIVPKMSTTQLCLHSCPYTHSRCILKLSALCRHVSADFLSNVNVCRWFAGT